MRNQSKNHFSLSNYRPRSWAEVAGNRRLVKHFKEIIWRVRHNEEYAGMNTLITGPSRSGKTMLVEFGLKSLRCLRLDRVTLSPCHECEACRQSKIEMGPNWFDNYCLPEDTINHLPRRSIYVQTVDCANVTEAELMSLIYEFRFEYDDRVRFIFLDEAHRLHSKRLDEKLLKPMEDLSINWILASANIEKDSLTDTSKLDPMLQNRISYKFRTELPDLREMVMWLIACCEKHGIKVHNPKETLPMIAEKASLVPGIANNLLNVALQSRSKILDMEMVGDFIVSFDS